MEGFRHNHPRLVLSRRPQRSTSQRKAGSCVTHQALSRQALVATIRFRRRVPPLRLGCGPGARRPVDNGTPGIHLGGSPGLSKKRWSLALGVLGTVPEWDRIGLDNGGCVRQHHVDAAGRLPCDVGAVPRPKLRYQATNCCDEDGARRSRQSARPERGSGGNGSVERFRRPGRKDIPTPWRHLRLQATVFPDPPPRRRPGGTHQD